MSKTFCLRIATLTVATLVTGCRATPTTEPDTAPAAATQTDDDQHPATVAIDESLAKLCDLPTPSFDYDSAKLSSSASAMLDALAQCFISGRGKNESVLIVGHADPRGDEEYNYALGQRRADSVERHLTSRGLAAPRIESSSRGELDAVGTDEGSWRLDRRVEITLAR